MLKVASERQALALLLSNCLNELEMYSKAQPIIESVMAQEAAEVQMKESIEHERLTTSAVRQLRNDLREEKLDHEEKVRAVRVDFMSAWGTPTGRGTLAGSMWQQGS